MLSFGYACLNGDGGGISAVYKKNELKKQLAFWNAKLMKSGFFI